jgi:hypothetical protein
MRSTLQTISNAVDMRSALLTLGAALLAAIAVLVVAGSGSVKVIAAAMAGSLFLAGAILSGNPRLFSLYGLMVAVPFDLSKRLARSSPKWAARHRYALNSATYSWWCCWLTSCVISRPVG